MSVMAAPRLQSANTQYAQLPQLSEKLAQSVSVNVDVLDARRRLVVSDSVDLSHKRFLKIDGNMDVIHPVSIAIDSLDNTPRSSVHSDTECPASSDCLPADGRWSINDPIPESDNEHSESSPCAQKKKQVKWNKYNRVHDTYSPSEYHRKATDRRYTMKEMQHIRAELDDLHQELLRPDGQEGIIGAPALLRDEDLGDRMKHAMHSVEHSVEHVVESAVHSVVHLLENVHLPSPKASPLHTPTHTPMGSPRTEMARKLHAKSSLRSQYLTLKQQHDKKLKTEAKKDTVGAF
eukprot:comp11544_c0_seq1/m.6003 comp11544_c0_seq1/g.6003  ORF comp11544_c0_seq1/g.6003 comp11544_c0_seq1/m.6003 type:complete len:291 (-) comp11544_c0_seq1:199-1071(-)